MKSSRLIVAIMLLSLTLVCFISAPVFSGDDPWDVDGDMGGGSGSDGDSIELPPGDSLIIQDDHSIGGGFGPDWLSGLSFQVSYQIIKYFLGDDETSGKQRDVVEVGSGNVTAQ